MSSIVSTSDLLPDNRRKVSSILSSCFDLKTLILSDNLIPPLMTMNPQMGLSDDALTCTACNSVFHTTIGYQSHMRRMSLVIKYACLYCQAPMVFFNKCTFLCHVNKHTSHLSTATSMRHLNSHRMSVSSLPSKLLPKTGRECLFISYLSILLL